MKQLENVYTGLTAQRYDDDRQKTVMWQREDQIVGDVLKKTLVKGATVLDLAAGTGRWLDVYSKVGVKPYITDVSADMLDVARAKAAELGVEASVEVLDALRAERIPPADFLVSTRFFNWISLEDVASVLRKAQAAGIERAVFTAKTLDWSAGLLAAWSSKRYYARRNRKAESGKHHKGVYHLHSEAAFGKMLERLGVQVEGRTVVSQVKGRSVVSKDGAELYSCFVCTL